MAIHATITDAPFDAPRNDVPPSLADRGRDIQVSAEYIGSLAQAVQLCLETYESGLRKMAPGIAPFAGELGLAQSLLNLLGDQAMGIGSAGEAIEMQAGQP